MEGEVTTLQAVYLTGMIAVPLTVILTKLEMKQNPVSHWIDVIGLIGLSLTWPAILFMGMFVNIGTRLILLHIDRKEKAEQARQFKCADRHMKTLSAVVIAERRSRDRNWSIN